MKKLLIAVLATIATTATSLAYEGYQYGSTEDRVTHMEEIIPFESIYKNVSGKATYKLQKLKQLRSVLRGTFYVGTTDGVPFGVPELTATCESMFSYAFFTREKDFPFISPYELECDYNLVRYGAVPLSYEYAVGQYIDAIYDVIANNRGPVLAHSNISGAEQNFIAAVALMEFCAWPSEDALGYWEHFTHSRYQAKFYSRFIQNYQPRKSRIQFADRKIICKYPYEVQ